MGRHKFVHESSAGLTPKPKEGSSDKEGRGADATDVVGHSDKKDMVRGESLAPGFYR